MAKENTAAGTTWERTSALRIVKHTCGIVGGEHIEQAWFCRETGEVRWRPLPIEICGCPVE